MFSIDGLEWDVPCRIERVAEVTSSDISGMLLNRQYFNDVLGTWMRYTITVVVPFGYEDMYTDLYETLSAPKDGHTFVMPYNQSTIQFTGRVQTVSDNYILEGTRKRWRRTTFDVIANHPSKQMSLGSVISTGLTPIPPEADPNVGDIYEYTINGWVQRFYEDVDEVYY